MTKEKFIQLIKSLDMPDHDINNLVFILSASKEILKSWYFSVEKDDIDYAFELLEEAQNQLNDRTDDDEISAELKAYLKNFQLQ